MKVDMTLEGKAWEDFIKSLADDTFGALAERLFMKTVLMPGKIKGLSSCRKIDTTGPSNDILLFGDFGEKIVEIKAAKDFGYKTFFCETEAIKKGLWEKSFWRSQEDISMMIYFSASEKLFYLYDFQKFKAHALEMEEAGRVYPNYIKTGKGFLFYKEAETSGYLGVITTKPPRRELGGFEADNKF
jgi:hypothetical protein